MVLFTGLFLAFAFGLDLYSNVTKAVKSLRTWQYVSVPGNSKKKIVTHKIIRLLLVALSFINKLGLYVSQLYSFPTRNSLF